ncbi:MAG: hypothetical protein ACPGQL_10110 [Thermoplasmatota archaeon]
MLADNPLLTVLGRRGRGAVLQALLAAPDQVWTVRGLAHEARVPPTVASRTVKELAALAAVDVLRPGRDAQIRFLADSAAGRAMVELAGAATDLRGHAAAAFAGGLPHDLGSRLVRWHDRGDAPSGPTTPTRLALIGDDEDDLLDAVGPALDAVRAAGLPEPEVTTWTPELLAGGPEDPVAAAVRAGTPVSGSRPTT